MNGGVGVSRCVSRGSRCGGYLVDVGRDVLVLDHHQEPLSWTLLFQKGHRTLFYMSLGEQILLEHTHTHTHTQTVSDCSIESCVYNVMQHTGLQLFTARDV